MRLIAHLASLAEKHVPELAAYHPQKVFQHFVKSLQNELNFMTEGHQADQVAANFEGHEQIVIPKIYWEWTRPRINVQEFVDGIPGVNIRAIDAAGMDRTRIAQTGARAVLKMILIDGLFHADPHPGNFFILPGERIAFIDFGMIGRVSEGQTATADDCCCRRCWTTTPRDCPRFFWNGLTEEETIRGTVRSR